MHFVLTTIGSAGDVYPMVGLGKTLKERGHQVTLLTNGHFAPLAESNQLNFIPLGSSEEYHAAIESPDLWKPHKAFRHVYNFLKPHLKNQHRILAELSSREPTVCLASCLCFGARMLQETHQVPVVTVHLQPAVIWSDLEPPVLGPAGGPKWLRIFLFRLIERFVADPIVAPHLNEWRKEYKLPPMKRMFQWWNSPTGVLALFPDWFAPPQQDWPAPLIQTDFPLWNDGTNQGLSPDVQRFLDAGPAPIVFTPGTANIHGARFFLAAQETCQTLNRRGIFLTKYPKQLPTQLPESIQHFDYSPLDLLLPHCSAFVHHGGIGSTSQGLLAGIPQVIMPLAHDQFDNAARVKRLNVGRAIPEGKFTHKRLTQTLTELLSSQAVAESCRQIRQKMLARDGLERTVIELETRFC